MPKRIKIFDTTLRDGEQTPGVNLNIHEKLEIANQLVRLGVDVIEAGFATASPGDFNAVSAIAKEMKTVTVASLSRAVKKDIDVAWEAVSKAKNPRIHTFIATSDIHMLHKLKMNESEVLERAVEMVKYAKKYCYDVEFSAEDASRSRGEFLYRVLEGVIRAGATVVNIPDTVGYALPDEFGRLIRGIKENVSGMDKVELSVHCHNDLGLGVANTLSALQNGATQVECTVNGLGERAGNAALEEIIMCIQTRGDHFSSFSHGIDTVQISRTSKLVSTLTGVSIQKNKAIVGANAFAHESGIHQHGILTERSTYEIMTPESVGISQNKMVLGKLSGRHAFEQRLKDLGLPDLSDEELKKAFEKFKILADKKKNVTDKDIEALVDEGRYENIDTYKYDSFQVIDGNTIVPTVTVTIKKGEESITEAATGDGPVDAAFNAIERATHVKMELMEYQIHSITEGRDAQGEVIVKVKNGDRVLLGHGISTDIVEASVLAYLNAINKVME
jgi:2-isopropylmalate synthase